MMWLVQFLSRSSSLCDTANQIWKVTGCCGDLGESPRVLKTGFECSLSHAVCLLYSQYWNYYFLAWNLTSIFAKSTGETVMSAVHRI